MILYYKQNQIYLYDNLQYQYCMKSSRAPKCSNKNWIYCAMKNGMCVNCERGHATIIPCDNTEFAKCDFKVSKNYQDGVCINCGKVSCSAKTVINKIHAEINLYPDNFELFYDLGDIIRQNNVELTTNEIRDLCTFWYKKSKATSKRLSDSNELFRILDHSNSGLTRPINSKSNERMITMKTVGELD